mgnify:FL=1
MMKCYSCGWEGSDEELVREPASLMFYDNLLKDQLKGAEVTRENLLCPKCRTQLKSVRLIDGIVFQKG